MMKRFGSAALVAGLLCVLGIPAYSQDGLAIRIVTNKEGVHRIPGEALKAHHPLDRIAPDRLSLTHDGEAVLIEVFGSSDGHFDASDEIIFFAEKPRERHTKTETYILTDRGKAARLKNAAAVDRAADSLAEVQVVAHTARPAEFDQLATVRQDLIRGPMPSPWFTAKLSPRGTRVRGDRSGAESDASTSSIGVLLDPRPVKGLPARLRVNAFGAVANGIPQKLGVNVNGTDLAPQAWDTPLGQKLTFTIPAEVLRRETVVRFTNLTDVPAYAEPGNELSSRRRNDVLIEDFSIVYDAQLAGPTVSGQQIVFHLAAGESTRPRQIKIEQRQREGYLIVEPKAGRLSRNTVVEVPSDREVTLAVCSLGGSYLPEKIEPLRATREHITGTGGDYVIVTTSDLRPAVAMLADHRRASGLTPVVVEARELYDAFTYGAFHPAAIQRFLSAGMLNWQKKPRYLLLVGDADLDVDWINQRETLPAWLVMTDYNGVTATDALHGDVDADGLPEVAVGRIPVRTREDLLNVSRRIVALETTPPSGGWRRRITFFAGEGRFGPAIDRLLENQAAEVIRKIPAEFDVQMTYGSPNSDWYWPAEDFNGQLIRSFNDGSLVFTYIGHGSPEAFDHVKVGNRVYPILSTEDVDRLASEGKSPVMAIIACSTGRYDDPQRDCLAEKLLLREGGPIAVIAASRISHPYPNGLLGMGISQPFFEENNRVGDAFLAGTRAMITEAGKPLSRLAAKAFLSKAVDDKTLVRDHVYIYNLFGDPAQRVPFAAPIATIEASDTVKPGGTVEVTAALGAGASGEAIVSLEAPRGRRIGRKAESEPTNTGAEDAAATRAAAIKARHAAANDHAIARGRFKVEDGALKATLEVPADTPAGAYAVVIFLAGGSGTPDAAGSKKIRVE